MATSFTQTPALQRNSSEQNRFVEKVMANILSFYDEHPVIDVTFKVSNPTAVGPAHRLILAAASPHIENLLKGEQGNNPVIEINDIDSDIFKVLITFRYTGEELITINNVGSMLKEAIVSQLDDVITSCVDYLMIHINECTLHGAYTLQREAQCERLKQKLIEYVIKNSMEVAAHNGHIYILDKHSAIRSQSVERYDPRRNTWSKICCLDADWARITGMSLDNKLWFFGRPKHDDISSVSVHDEDTAVG